jgi:hypothetical protein
LLLTIALGVVAVLLSISLPSVTLTVLGVPSILLTLIIVLAVLLIISPTVLVWLAGLKGLGSGLERGRSRLKAVFSSVWAIYVEILLGLT